MKKNLIKLVTLFIFIFGSVQTNAQESVVTQNELPQSAQTFIKKHFSGHNVDYIMFERNFLSSNEYTVRFTDGLKIEFDGKGSWKEIDGKYTEIPTDFISKNILTYVNAKFSNTKIVKIEKIYFGNQEVKLSNGLELIFDSKGNFKRVDD